MDDAIYDSLLPPTSLPSSSLLMPVTAKDSLSSVDADPVLASSYAAAVNSSKRGAIDDSVKGNRNETNNNN